MGRKRSLRGYTKTGATVRYRSAKRPTRRPVQLVRTWQFSVDRVGAIHRQLRYTLRQLRIQSTYSIMLDGKIGSLQSAELFSRAPFRYYHLKSLQPTMPRSRIPHTKRAGARFQSWCQARRMIRLRLRIVRHGKYSRNGENHFSPLSATATLLRAAPTRRFSNWYRVRRVSRIRRSKMPDIFCRKKRGRSLRR